jgi:hypothetical protein
VLVRHPERSPIADPTSPVERVLQLVGADRVLAILRPGILSPEPATPIRSTAAAAIARTAWL